MFVRGSFVRHCFIVAWGIGISSYFDAVRAETSQFFATRVMKSAGDLSELKIGSSSPASEGLRSLVGANSTDQAGVLDQVRNGDRQLLLQDTVDEIPGFFGDIERKLHEAVIRFGKSEVQNRVLKFLDTKENRVLQVRDTNKDASGVKEHTGNRVEELVAELAAVRRLNSDLQKQLVKLAAATQVPQAENPKPGLNSFLDKRDDRRETGGGFAREAHGENQGLSRKEHELWQHVQKSECVFDDALFHLSM